MKNTKDELNKVPEQLLSKWFSVVECLLKMTQNLGIKIISPTNRTETIDEILNHMDRRTYVQWMSKHLNGMGYVLYDASCFARNGIREYDKISMYRFYMTLQKSALRRC